MGEKLEVLKQIRDGINDIRDNIYVIKHMLKLQDKLELNFQSLDADTKHETISGNEVAEWYVSDLQGYVQYDSTGKYYRLTKYTPAFGLLPIETCNPIEVKSDLKPGVVDFASHQLIDRYEDWVGHLLTGTYYPKRK